MQPTALHEYTGRVSLGVHKDETRICKTKIGKKHRVFREKEINKSMEQFHS